MAKKYYKKQSKAKPTNVKKYHISILKDTGYDFNELMDWIAAECTGKFYYRHFKKNTVFTFFELDDGFKFKMHWEIA